MLARLLSLGHFLVALTFPSVSPFPRERKATTIRISLLTYDSLLPTYEFAPDLEAPSLEKVGSVESALFTHLNWIISRSLNHANQLSSRRYSAQTTYLPDCDKNLCGKLSNWTRINLSLRTIASLRRYFSIELNSLPFILCINRKGEKKRKKVSKISTNMAVKVFILFELAAGFYAGSDLLPSSSRKYNSNVDFSPTSSRIGRYTNWSRKRKGKIGGIWPRLDRVYQKRTSFRAKPLSSIIEIEISTRSRRRAFLVKAGVHQPLTFPRPNSSLNESTGFVNSARWKAGKTVVLPEVESDLSTRWQAKSKGFLSPRLFARPLGRRRLTTMPRTWPSARHTRRRFRNTFPIV